MNMKLQKLVKDCNAIAEEREGRRSKLQENIAQAEADLQKSEDDKQAATDANAYADAADRGRRAADMLEFYQGSLAIADKPTMTQSEYDAKQAEIKSCVSDAAEAFRKRADEIGAQLVAAYEECAKVAEDANQAQEALDKAAGILQAEHGNAWRRYAMRYEAATMRALFVHAERGSGGFYSRGDADKVEAWDWLSHLMGWK